MKRAIVFGAGGFIGDHLVCRLKKEGYWVRGVDIKHPEYSTTSADDFIIGDLRCYETVYNCIDYNIDELYQLAADMGGAGYVFSGDNDANIMHNSSLINLNTVKASLDKKVKCLFYASSACIYPDFYQLKPDNPNLQEETAYPANPDSEYGWEKLFSERLFLSFKRNYQLNCKIGRFHNIYGPKGAWNNGKEKAPAALCRKIAEAKDNTNIEIWGDGQQTRSFLYVDDCIDAIMLLMKHPTFYGPVNIGSEEMISINDFADLIIDLSGKKLGKINVDGPTGVRGRNSHNQLIMENLKWKPKFNIQKGINITYNWILEQLSK